jgi:hypothetical protein
MKHFFLSVVLSLLACMAFSQTKLYENPKFDSITKNHKIIGIVPFKTTVKLRPKEMKDMSAEKLKNLEISEGNNLQAALYSWFKKREQRGDLSVKVLDPMTTNALLKKNDITEDNIAERTPGELAQTLGVDAVITGTYETNKPMSEGAAVALGLLGGFYGPTNKAVINLFIFNAADGELLVNYNKGVSGSVFTSSEDLVNILMRKASRRISYSKKDTD